MADICKECKDCWNYKVCEIGCFGSDKPCEHYVGEDRDEVLKKRENRCACAPEPYKAESED